MLYTADTIIMFTATVRVVAFVKKEAFRLFDLDNDGNIDFNEFSSAMKFLGQTAK